MCFCDDVHVCVCERERERERASVPQPSLSSTGDHHSCLCVPKASSLELIIMFTADPGDWTHNPT